MKKKNMLLISFLLITLSMYMIIDGAAYAIDIHPVQDASTTVKWEILTAPPSAFSMYFTGAGNCLIQERSILNFSVSEIHDDVNGFLEIGNVSIMTNDTDISRDLVLGIGIFSPFEPGLFIKVGSSNIETLNTSAFSAAARVSGNYMNGTISSIYDNVTLGDNEYQAIIFDYEQDQPYAGDPQRTRLIYDLTTGVLLYANTSYWFGDVFEPFSLEMEFIEISHEGGYLPPTTIYPALIATVVVVLFIGLIILRRR